MVAAIIFAVVAALAVGVGLGWFIARHAPVPPSLPDPVVLQTYAAKRVALQKEAPLAPALSLADAAAALRTLAK